jgi:hypothetical protein
METLQGRKMSDNGRFVSNPWEKIGKIEYRWKQ